MLDIAILCPEGPGDVRPLNAWLEQLPKERIEKIAVLGKTEGPATLNDYSRDLAQAATDRAIADFDHRLVAHSFRLFSTGCEGIATPVTIAIANLAGSNATTTLSGLAFGVAHSDALPVFPRCGLGHIDIAARTVECAMANGGLQPEQVALVVIKSPILIPGMGTSDTKTFARHVGSTGSSRGAAAIGAGVALREVDRSELSADPVGRDDVFASRVMAFSGIETDRIETLVLGIRSGGDARWTIATGTISDLLDVRGIARIKAAAIGRPEMIFFKAGIASNGRLRGHRTTVLTSDLSADKQLRAAASGLVAAHFGTTCAFISGGAEHQAPSGGCLCAILCRQD